MDLFSLAMDMFITLLEILDPVIYFVELVIQLLKSMIWRFFFLTVRIVPRVKGPLFVTAPKLTLYCKQNQTLQGQSCCDLNMGKLIKTADNLRINYSRLVKRKRERKVCKTIYITFVAL